SETVALTLMVRAEADGYGVTPLMPSWFIPCVGASSEVAPVKVPASAAEARAIRSVWATADRMPDDSAVAISRDVWFSTSEPVAIH
ncbi:MAG: SAM-dependent methyltransferase, partial [Sphingomonadales bacterium]